MLALWPGVATGDINGDEHIDIVFAVLGANQSPLACTGPQFTSCAGMGAVPSGPGPYPAWTQGVALGDMNHDGALDAVFAVNQQPPMVCLADASAPTGFSCTFVSGLREVQYYTHGVALGDLDGDGDLDAVFAGLGSFMCEGNGAGLLADCRFINRGTTSGPQPGEVGYAVALGDVDNDRDLDALFVNRRHPGVGTGDSNRVCLGDGHGDFVSCRDVDAANEGNTIDVALGDVNKDGDLDAVFAGHSSAWGQPAHSRVCLGDGTGAFPLCQNVDRSSAAPFASMGVALGDLNGDSLLDAVFANRGDLPGRNRVCIGTGFDPSSSDPQQSQLFSCADVASEGHNSSDVALGDVDDDGDLDAVFSRADGSQHDKNLLCLWTGASGAWFSCRALSDGFNTAVALTPVKYRFIALADSRSPADKPGVGAAPRDSYNATVLAALLAKARSLEPAFVWFGGDLVWGRLTTAAVREQLSGRGDHTGANAGFKDAVNAAMGDPSYATTRLYPAYGGHEKNFDGNYVFEAFTQEFRPVETGIVHRAAAYFSPGPNCPDQSATYGTSVYYFDYKNARFFTLNNDTVYNAAAADEAHENVAHVIEACQQEWLDAHLEARPLNFFIHHEPAFPVKRTDPFDGSNPEDVARRALRDAYVAKAGSHNAVLMFAGHEHEYTRRRVNANLIPGASFPGEFWELKIGIAGANPLNTVAPVDTRQVEVLEKFDDHFAVVDVEGPSTSVVVVGRNPTTGAFSCIDVVPAAGPFARFVDRNGNGNPDTCDTINGFVAPGIPDATDVDSDGVPNPEDRDTAVVSVAGGAQLAIDLPEQFALTAVQAFADTASALDQATKPAHQSFPFGAVSFDVQEINPVREVAITLTFSVPVPEQAVYFVYDSKRGWYTIPIGSHDGDERISLVLTDGGDGDVDGAVNKTIRHVGTIAAPGPEPLNAVVSFATKSIAGFRSNGAACLVDEEAHNPFIGTYAFTARLTNRSGTSLFGVQAVTTELSNGNRLQNADGEPGGVGTRLTISTGPIAPNGFVDVPFVICVRERIPFRFFVNVTGFMQ